MPNFRYRVRDRQGKALDGVVEGSSVQNVSQALSRQGYIPIQVSEVRGDSGPGLDLLAFLRQKVKLAERNLFSRQLWTLQRAGVPLLNSLNSLRDQARSPYLRKVIVRLIKDLEAGDSFSTALSRFPDAFDRMYVNMVRSGEASGKLDEVLLHLAEMGEFEAETRERVKAATRYPIITFMSLIVAFITVVTFVIPKFSAIYTQFTHKLPLPTRILMGINRAVREDWALLAVGGVALIFVFRYVLGTARGRYLWDLLKIRMPVFGPLFFNLQMSRFARILAELLASGVPILQALQLVSEAIGNSVIRRALRDIQESVNEGKGMSEPMRRSGLFAPMVYQMVAVGEQSGKTDELLRHVADHYQAQASYMMKNLTSLIEPLLILLIGGLVVLLATGVFLPMWDLVKVVR